MDNDNELAEARQLPAVQVEKEKMFDKTLQDKFVFEKLEAALDCLKGAKPNNRSDLDRRYAVTITNLENALAYFHYFVVDRNGEVKVVESKD